MSTIRQATRQPFQAVKRSVQCQGQTYTLPVRAFSSTSAQNEAVVEEQQQTPLPPPVGLNPDNAYTPYAERKLLRLHNKTPIGSRRRRAALQSSSKIPFEHLPYQCFQEARKVLAADREEKLKQIDTQRARIARLRAQDVATQNERQKEHRLASMHRHLEELKILADINDPIVKKKFEDGEGDLSKPIYRFLADKEWRKYKRNILVQRITQMNVVPDILPSLDPIINADLSFGNRAVQPGEFVDSRVSEIPGKLKIQVYNKGERYLTIAVVNPDVPNVAKDGFDYRCHFLACNIKVSPTEGSVILHQLSQDSQVVLPWLPAYTQKGAPYQRMAIIILEQAEGQILDAAALKNKTKRNGFIMRSFIDKHLLKPVGANLFRSQYDEGTAGVMQRAGITGHNVEFKRMKVEPLPYKKLPGSRYR